MTNIISTRGLFFVSIFILFIYFYWLVQALKCQMGRPLRKQPHSYLHQIKYDVYPDYCPFNMQENRITFNLRVTPLDIFRLNISQIIHAVERQIHSYK